MDDDDDEEDEEDDDEFGCAAHGTATAPRPAVTDAGARSFPVGYDVDEDDDDEEDSDEEDSDEEEEDGLRPRKKSGASAASRVQACCTTRPAALGPAVVARVA